MERWVGKIAIVTGAAAGIGYAITELLINEGVKVVGVDFNKEKLNELKIKFHDKKGMLYVYNADLRKEDDILAMFKWVKENVGPIHILINCAGIYRFTSLTEGKTELWRDVFDTNAFGLCIATREAVKDMRANNVDGHIIHINSIAGFKSVNIPDLNFYAASKYAVRALAETFKNELISCGDRIKISSIYPGSVKTDILSSSAKASGSSVIPDFFKNIYEVIPYLQPEDIADAVKLLLSTSPHVQIHELTIQAVGDPS